jgi:hypothetical protein
MDPEVLPPRSVDEMIGSINLYPDADNFAAIRRAG